jgi:hypothetical protein
VEVVSGKMKLRVGSDVRKSFDYRALLIELTLFADDLFPILVLSENFPLFLLRTPLKIFESIIIRLPY